MRWALITIFWLVIGGITSVQAYYAYARSRNPLGPGACISVGLLYGFSWLACMPLMLWLLRRFPLIRTRLSVSVPVHVVTGLIIGGAHHMANNVLMTYLPGVPRIEFRLPGLIRDTFLRIDVEAMTYWAALALWEGASWYMKYQDGLRRQAELENRLARAQLEALRMQLNPHFLFNTLHTISSMIHIDPQAADLMVVRLSEFLRMTLDAHDSQEATLEEELQFVERYLEIEKIRFSDRLQVQYAVQPETLSCRVPRLILQPLVENAIRHGISKVVGPAMISIGACIGADGLVLTVRDNGPGVAENGNGNGSTNGVGLRNTRERLDRLYGTGQHMSVRNLDNEGVEARITIPAAPPEEIGADHHR